MIIGIIGGGQLARMMMLAGYPLDLRFITLDPSPDTGASQIGHSIQAPYDDENALRQLADQADVVTFEFENVPDKSIQFLSEHLPVFPSPQALGTAQDRLAEKTLFNDLGIATPGFQAVDNFNDLELAAKTLGLPLILKTRRLGYDGKGQARIRVKEDMQSAWEALGGVPLIAEQWVPFDREISIIAVRAQSKETRYYPVPENTHKNGILHLSVCRPGDPMQAAAENYIDRILTHLNYVGVLTLELFQVGDELLANEIAPRVHNSGHWTLEGAEISQFENHIRAVANLPLGSTEAKGYSAMVNFIGNIPEAKIALSQNDLHFHAYGKTARPGRKVGHATINSSNKDLLDKKIENLVQISMVNSKV